MANIQLLGPTANKAGKTSSDLAIFKDFLGSPETSIPLNSNFIIGFNNIPNLIENFGDTEVGELEPSKWKIDQVKQSLISIIKDPSSSDGSSNYCLFAQGITLPVESLRVDRAGPNFNSEYSGGLLSGVVAKDRETQNTLDTTFLETNYSFVDFLIRPWVIAVSHYGLRERKNSSLKTDLTVIFFDKFNNNAVRKIYTFFKCAPVSFGGITASYGDNSLILPKVSWVYNYYSVSYGE